MRINLAWPLIALVRFYQLAISPWLAPRCKYHPSCSRYSLQCLQTHGLLRGTILTIWRLLRCNPYSLGGVDYPPLPGQWCPAPYRQMTDEELAAHWAEIDRVSKSAGHDPAEVKEQDHDHVLV